MPFYPNNAYVTIDDIKIDPFETIKYEDEDNEETPVMGETYKTFEKESPITNNPINKTQGPCYLCNVITNNYFNHKNNSATRICPKCVSDYLIN